MESFIYPELKKASLNKDESRIPTLGPYAAVLSFIIRNANISRIKKKCEFFLERLCSRLKVLVKTLLCFVQYSSYFITKKQSTVGYLVRYGSRLKTEMESGVFFLTVR